MSKNYRIRTYQHPTITFLAEVTEFQDNLPTDENQHRTLISYTYQCERSDFKNPAYQGQSFRCDIKYIKDETIQVSFKIESISPYLNEIFKTTTASLVVDIECQDTLYRKICKESLTLNNYSDLITRDIGLSNLLGDVNFNFHIVANQEVLNYTPSNMHSDYTPGTAFVVSQFSPFASLIGAKIHISYTWDQKNLITVIRNKDNHSDEPWYEISFGEGEGQNDSIKIHMIAPMHDLWKQIRNRPESQMLLHGVYQDALVQAVLLLAESDQDENEPYWQEHLKKKVSKESIDEIKAEADGAKYLLAKGIVQQWLQKAALKKLDN